MKNLFQAGRPVVGENLIGREKIIKNIIDLLTFGQSVVLIGPRRFGKTSIVLEVINRLKNQKYFTAYTDIFATPTKRILSEQIIESVLTNKKLNKAFSTFRKSISSMMKQVEFKQVIEDFEFILNFVDSNQNESSLLTDSIDFIEQFAIKNNKNIVCAFDEFGDIEKLDGKEIVKLFRSKIQLQKSSVYIFSGSHESVMEKIFIASNSPFYRFARIIPIMEISQNVFKKYIKRVFLKIGITIDADGVNRILKFTNGHPYYTQLVCQQLNYSINNKGKKKINEKSVDDAIEEAFWSEINYIEKLWEELSVSKEQTQVLISLIKSDDSVYKSLDINQINVSRGLRNLKIKGIIQKENKSYYIVDPMLKYFINRDILNIKISEWL